MAEKVKKSNARALALIDRDGTLIEERHYLADPAKVVLTGRAVRAIQLLKAEGVACVVTTNQSGVGRGKITMEQLHQVHDRLFTLLENQRASLDGLYYCTADPDSEDPAQIAEMTHRKPAPGMALEAMLDLGLHNVPVYSIGDKVADVEFGRNAKGTGILVSTGYGAQSEAELDARRMVVPITPDVYDAARWILLDLVKKEVPQDTTLARKLKTAGEMRRVAAKMQLESRRLVLANGCFDLLHGGHISFLENARSAGEALVLAVNSNASITRLKGKGRPILDEAGRLQMLAALQAVDYLTVFHTDSADEILEEIRPDIHAKGTDYTSENVPELQTSRRLGIKTFIAGNPKENSTRDIIEVVVERAKRGVL